jgi:hypothetical protein
LRIGKYHLMASVAPLAILLCLCIAFAPAQIPDTVWTKMYGFNGPFEWFQSVEQLPDSGYILCGSWNEDLFLMRTDHLGDSVWTKIYGEPGDDCGFCVTRTQDGGFILTGLRATGSGDLWLLRTDAAGDTIWTKTYGGPQDDIGFWVQENADGGYIVCGQTESLGGLFGTWLLKTDSLGDTLWTKVYEGLSASPGRRFHQTADGGFIITTNFLFSTNWDAFVIKTDAQGDTLWSQAYGGQFNENVTSFASTDDGGYLLAGYIGFPGANPDGWLLKIDSLGNMLWTQVYGGAGYEEFRSISKTLDSGYILCGGRSPSPMGFIDVWLMKIDAIGDSIWARTWGAGQADEASDVKVCFDGGYILAGSAFSAGIYDDAWLLKTEADVGIDEHTKKPRTNVTLDVSPNPFKHVTDIRYHITDNGYKITTTEVKIRIYDISGRLVKDFALSSVIGHQSSVKWDGTDHANQRLPCGVYLLEYRTLGSKSFKKLILLE